MTQTNAQRLADAIDPGDEGSKVVLTIDVKHASEELRRLDAIEQARDVAVEMAAQYAAERDQLRAELEAVRRDAERYRWLRNKAGGWYIGPAYSTYNDVVCDGCYNDLSGGGIALDSAIDAAQAAKGGA